MKCDNTAMLIVRESAHRIVPWKNGGGLTREILREPAEPAPFDWRLSLASIDSSGPFSLFEGYHRTLVLVEGAGVELDFGQHGRSRLTGVGQSVSFDGGWRTRCTLIEGRSTDLNLIISRERMLSATDSLRLTQPQAIQTARWPRTLVCCISGALQLSNIAGDREDLESVDVALCSPADGTVTCSPVDNGPAHVFLVHLAEIADAIAAEHAHPVQRATERRDF
jgi:environmental stress-induced protein Ves